MTRTHLAWPAPPLLAALLVCGPAGCANVPPRPRPCAAEKADAWPVPCSWLRRARTPAEAEARHTVNGVTFGNLHDERLELFSQMQPGDTLWFYSGSHDRPLGVMCHRPGEDGYLLVRGCKLVRRITVAYTFTR